MSTDLTNIKTLKFRVKDKHSKQLAKMAKSVNFVWNYVNKLSHRSISERKTFLSGFDLQKFTKGAAKDLSLNSKTVQIVTSEYALKRKRFKKSKLKWRKSCGAGRSLGWIPLNSQSAKWVDGKLKYNGNHFNVWDSYDLEAYSFKCGSFNEDARGRWYLNLTVSFPTKKSVGKKSVGIDFGCKQSATDSNGDGVKGREYRRLEESLGKAQRANKKKRVKTIHAKIKNRRKDALHKYSHKLVKENALIVVGNVSSQAMTKTKMAKSVLDAGWATLKTMLEYKCDHAGVVFEEVNEAYTTQTCSSCGVISANSPKGRAGLRIREWMCCECGVTHDRDINAATNILALGHQRLAEGISRL